MNKQPAATHLPLIQTRWWASASSNRLNQSFMQVSSSAFLDEANGVVHEDRVTRQHNRPVPWKPVLLFRHLQQLSEHRVVEISQRHHKAPPISSVDCKVALVHRWWHSAATVESITAAAAAASWGRGSLTLESRELLPLLDHLHEFLGTHHCRLKSEKRGRKSLKFLLLVSADEVDFYTKENGDRNSVDAWNQGLQQHVQFECMGPLLNRDV